jgi:hypothetical protein
VDGPNPAYLSLRLSFASLFVVEWSTIVTPEGDNLEFVLIKKSVIGT